ncbi:ATP/GTP-binding protein [Arthrobacter crystallopoietes]|uniref:TRAFAC clade GTPase domain-containing protein n=1 Tax=Crystallibacter crystallopoietes TaxID=37928 RepID=UPI003D263BD5
MQSRKREQHVAVFGESGSGKTVMLSSFYGAMQEPQFRKDSLFDVLAESAGQNTRLVQSYLGMKNSNRVPETDRFSGTSYTFSIKMKARPEARGMNSGAPDALRLVWHDYPGEWFEEDVSGPEEAQRRVDTFKALLRSDVALLLVDGQRLLDQAGEEERYLKSLLTNFHNGLLSLKDDLLEDGKRLVKFPRIWVMALSKADLLPDLDVNKFSELLIEKAGDDINDLREVIAGLVEAPDALSVGEDFMLLSSAMFNANKIEVTERVGLDLILPMAAVLPFERHVRWAQLKLLPGQVSERLLGAGAVGAAGLASALLGSRVRLPALLQGFIGVALSRGLLDDAARLAGDRLREINADAVAKHNYMTATLTGFRMDLEKGEKEKILLRSRR